MEKPFIQKGAMDPDIGAENRLKPRVNRNIKITAA